MARTCPACGRANDDDASFCQGCGAALADASAAGPSGAARRAPAARRPAQRRLAGRRRRAALPATAGATRPPPEPARPSPARRRAAGTPGWVVVLVVAVVIAVAAVARRSSCCAATTTDGAADSPTPSAGATVGVSPSPALGQYLAGAVGPKADRLATITADGTSSPSPASAASRSGRSPTPRTASGWPASPAPSSAASSGCSTRPAAPPGRRRPSTPNVVAVDSIAWLSPTRAAGRRLHGDAQGHRPERRLPRLRHRHAGASRRCSTPAACPCAASPSAPRATAPGSPSSPTPTSRPDQYGMATATERLELLDRASGAVTELGTNKAFFDVNARAFDEPLISPSGEAIIYRRAGSDVGTSYTVVGADGTDADAGQGDAVPGRLRLGPGRDQGRLHRPLPQAGRERGRHRARHLLGLRHAVAGSTQVVARYKDTDGAGPLLVAGRHDDRLGGVRRRRSTRPATSTSCRPTAATRRRSCRRPSRRCGRRAARRRSRPRPSP